MKPTSVLLMLASIAAMQLRRARRVARKVEDRRANLRLVPFMSFELYDEPS